MNIDKIVSLRVNNEKIFYIKLKEMYNAVASRFNASYSREGNTYSDGCLYLLTTMVEFIYINWEFVENLSNENLYMVLDCLTLAKSQKIKEAFILISPMIVQNLYKKYTNTRFVSKEEEFSLDLNRSYNGLISIMYYMKRKGYQASKERKLSNISSHLYGIYKLCVNNWDLVFALSKEDLCLVLNCFKLIRSENLFAISLTDVEKYKELEENYTNSR